MYYYVYQITNLINGKIYVGKHKCTKPPVENGYYGSGKLIKAAINKYGIDNFKKEVLYYCASGDEMAAKEAEVVTEEFVARTDTYNMHKGGFGGWDHHHGSAAHKEALSRGGRVAAKKLNEFIAEQKVNNTQWWKDWHTKVIKNNKEMTMRAKSPESIAKRKKTFVDINHQQGKKNSQFGTRFYLDPNTPDVKKRFKEGLQPEGWVWVEEYKEQRMKNSKRWFNDGNKNYYITLPNPIIKELELVKGRIR